MLLWEAMAVYPMPTLGDCGHGLYCRQAPGNAAVAALAWLWFGSHYLWRSIPSCVCLCVGGAWDIPYFLFVFVTYK